MKCGCEMEFYLCFVVVTQAPQEAGPPDRKTEPSNPPIKPSHSPIPETDPQKRPSRPSIKPARPAPPRPPFPPSRSTPPPPRPDRTPARYKSQSVRHRPPPSTTPPPLPVSSPTIKQLAGQRKRQLQSLRRELAGVEREQREMEARGVELEQRLRSNDDVEAVDDRLVEEWFSLVNEKNLLLRQVWPHDLITQQTPAS